MTISSSKRRMVLRAAAAMAVAVALPGCGFQLRGSNGSYTMPFRSIYIGFPDNSALGTELKRNLRAGNVAIADSATAAEAQLVVLSENRGKQILSLNSLGRVREYLLTYTLSFTVRDPKGVELMAPAEISLRRNMAFDETQVLAKESEEALLYRDMQADLVQQIMRRLAAMKPAT
ncbi:LPS assembly lipoprotein LptE [Herbaspirillum sp. SJZ107]|uniref:LPS-assembly lipoprotein LptE n=1 Tax=Herbaspirillum sp. SJZ107 TaxID=2572881 RepID=UPI00114D6BC8|nr:LPS assembly lipoprotein LptE [Herbaspirillum sp. SJZ107]TQK06821.1 LPS-assembly lipoprotein [Herbaspirillum sp. SJZ107]